MQVTVKYVNPPKEGMRSGSIKDINERYFGFDTTKFQFSPGQTYDIDVAERTARNGKVYTDVQAIRPRANGSSSVSSSGSDRYWMPFVSNICAHAIASGKISEPGQIKIWAAAAKEAAIEIDLAKAEKASDFDDDIPY